MLWLDAHSDFHTPATSASGNLHGTPVGYVTGLPGFDAFPTLPRRWRRKTSAFWACAPSMRRSARRWPAPGSTATTCAPSTSTASPPRLRAFLDRVAAANGMLHVSLDVDFLDPAIAPAVGTTVPGGASFREAHLVMEILHDSGLVTSLDLVELNPFLDDRGRTAS